MLKQHRCTYRRSLLLTLLLVLVLLTLASLLVVPFSGEGLPSTGSVTMGDRSSSRLRGAWSLVQQVWLNAAENSMRQPGSLQQAPPLQKPPSGAT
jgi:predicted PurR-regulated permease PerM